MLEVAVTVGITALVISAVAITTIIGLKNTEFSQNQIRSTKLAQEGLETIRSMRVSNNNIPICETSVDYGWSNSDLSSVWGHQFSNNDFYLWLNPQTQCNLKATQLSDSPNNAEKILQGKFKRTVKISDNGSSQIKQFAVTVTWDDSSGTHKSVLTTILTAYQNQ